MYTWLAIGHIVGVILWIGGLFTVYWLLRLHTQAPNDVQEKLMLMERSMALAMDLGAGLAITCGLIMALSQGGGEGGTIMSQFTHPGGNLFGAKGAGWFHIKLTVVVVGVLSVHGIIRGKVGKFSRGEKPTVPTWLWSVLLASIVAIVFLVFRGPKMFS